MNLKESFAIGKDGEVLVCGMHISPYEQGNIFNTDPLRQKKLLLHKSQIRHLAQEVGKMGYSLIPLQVYLKDGRFKMELGLCKGKKLHDKRDDMAAKDAQRDIQRALRSKNRGDDCARLRRFVWGCTGFDGIVGGQVSEPWPRAT